MAPLKKEKTESKYDRFFHGIVITSIKYMACHGKLVNSDGQTGQHFFM